MTVIAIFAVVIIAVAIFLAIAFIGLAANLLMQWEARRQEAKDRKGWPPMEDINNL